MKIYLNCREWHVWTYVSPAICTRHSHNHTHTHGNTVTRHANLFSKMKSAFSHLISRAFYFAHRNREFVTESTCEWKCLGKAATAALDQDIRSIYKSRNDIAKMLIRRNRLFFFSAALLPDVSCSWMLRFTGMHGSASASDMPLHTIYIKNCVNCAILSHWIYSSNICVRARGPYLAPHNTFRHLTAPHRNFAATLILPALDLMSFLRNRQCVPPSLLVKLFNLCTGYLEAWSGLAMCSSRVCGMWTPCKCISCCPR